MTKLLFRIAGAAVAGFLLGSLVRQPAAQQQPLIPCATAWIEWAQGIQSGSWEPTDSFQTSWGIPMTQGAPISCGAAGAAVVGVQFARV